MKKLLPLILIALIGMTPVHADPTTSKPETNFSLVNERIYFGSRVFVVHSHRARSRPLSGNVYSGIGFDHMHKQVPPTGALMDWRHVYSFYVLNPTEVRIPSSYRYIKFLAHLRRTPNPVFLDTQIGVGRKFVASEFANEELPPVFLHKRTASMKNALELATPPLVTTVEVP